MMNNAIIVLYITEMKSIPEIGRILNMPRSTIRLKLIKEGITLRSRTEGIRNCKTMGSCLRGKHRKFSDRWKENIRLAKLMQGERTAKGTSHKKNGYIEYTRGIHKGRAVHRVVMETILGRPLKRKEHVHHIDKNRGNNSVENLQLMTISEHIRLHRREKCITV